MSRPTLEVADIFRAQACDKHTLSVQQLKVIRAITRCRTLVEVGRGVLCRLLAAVPPPGHATHSGEPGSKQQQGGFRHRCRQKTVLDARGIKELSHDLTTVVDADGKGEC